MRSTRPRPKLIVKQSKRAGYLRFVVGVRRILFAFGSRNSSSLDSSLESLAAASPDPSAKPSPEPSPEPSSISHHAKSHPSANIYACACVYAFLRGCGFARLICSAPVRVYCVLVFFYVLVRTWCVVTAHVHYPEQLYNCIPAPTDQQCGYIVCCS